MWRWITRGGLISGCLLAFLSSGAFAQDFVGFVDKPADGQTVYGMVLIQGWALAEDEISRVDLYVDDQFQHSANINVPRTDIVQQYPDWQGIQGRKPGFNTGFTASRFSNGAHTIHLLVTTDDGKVWEVGRRTVVIDNSINQSPFGYVDIPNDSSIFDAHGAFPVAGWAADTDGISRVDVLIDGFVLQGAIHGDARPDVGNAFPDLPAALFSGFIANIDTTAIQDGVHTLQVRATDARGFSRMIGRRTIQVFNSENNLRPFGFLDRPLRDSVLYGTGCGDIDEGPVIISPQVPFDPDAYITHVNGWALDLGARENTGRVSYVELLIDGVPWYSTDDCQWVDEIGDYVNCYGEPRMDVAKYYPTFPDAPRSGFVFALDVGALLRAGVPPGLHSMKVRVGDQEQTFADIPNTAGIPVYFTCADLDDDFASIGFIDYPSGLEFLQGTVTFHGWALDQNINGVNSVQIWVDGQFLGLALYGYPRTDVKAAYPAIANSLNSGWGFTFDTTQIADGRHRVTVRVLDMAGNTSEIGSVDFVVDNPQN